VTALQSQERSQTDVTLENQEKNHPKNAVEVKPQTKNNKFEILHLFWRKLTPINWKKEFIKRKTINTFY